MLDMSARYTVAGYRGVAFYLLGWAPETREVEVWACEGTHDDNRHDDTCEWWTETETDDSDTFVRAVMVGDDREHIVDVDDLTPISEADYCHECGQVGCTADGYPREAVPA